MERKVETLEYRRLPHGGEKISVIGLGMGYIHESSEDDIEKIINRALDEGINYFDMAAAEVKPYACYGRAIGKRRKEAILQMHFGAVYETGKYGWTQDLGKIKSTFEEQLEILETDYTDIGFVHCIDKKEDIERAISGGLWDYMKELKRSGVIRHLGLSSHDPKIVRRMLDTGIIDMVMFSINPAYDYENVEYGIGSVSERAVLYRECEKEGVGISVMKPFGGGQLLDEKTSPFKKKLTHYQCIRYALDKPAVLTVLPGIRDMKDLELLLGYCDAGDDEKDYSIIGGFTPKDAVGTCVYCNHCQPCPQGIDVGLVNKYYDLAKAGDDLAASHYKKLEPKANACVKCGHCESRCPFHVKQESRMERIAGYFGK